GGGEWGWRRAGGRDHVLVGGDDRLAGEQRGANPWGGGLEAADRLDDDIGVAVQDDGDVGRPGNIAAESSGVPFARGTAIENVCELKRSVADGEAAGDGRTDGTESEQRDTTGTHS